MSWYDVTVDQLKASREAELLPPGEYNAELFSISVNPQSDRMLLKFRILDEPYADVVRSGSIPPSNSKWGQIAFNRLLDAIGMYPAPDEPMVEFFNRVNEARPIVRITIQHREFDGRKRDEVSAFGYRRYREDARAT